MSRIVEVNQVTLIAVMLYDSASNQFPRARVYNAAGVEQAGSPFNLTHVVNGYYSNNAWTPTVEGEYFITVRVFSDAGYTTLNFKYQNFGETVEVRSMDQDLATLLTRIGTPATTVSGDIAAIQTKLGTPVGATMSADIASIQADTNDIQAKIGAPVSTLAGDIAAVQTKLGTPAGATMSADIASIQADTNDIQTKIGLPVSTLAGDIASVQVDTNDIQARIGVPAGTLATDIAAVQADTDDLQARIGVPATTIAGDIASVQADTDAIQTSIGSPVSTLAGDIADVKADTEAILDDTGTSGVVITPAAEAQLVDAVWDELMAGHTIPGSAGHTLTNIDGNVTIIGDDGAFQSTVPASLERPDTGTASLKTFVRIYNAKGEPLDPDFDQVQVTVQDSAGTTIFPLEYMTRTDFGHFEHIFTVTPAAPVGSYYLLYLYSVASKTYERVDAVDVVDPLNLAQIVNAIWDEPLANHVAADTMGFAQNTIDDIYADTDSLDTVKLTTARADNLDFLDAAVSSREAEADALARFNATAADIAALQADTDDIQAKIGTPASTVSGDIAAIKGDTEAIIAATVSGVALSPAAEAQLVDAVWDELQTGHVAAGSFGSHLDTTVSSRESEADALLRFDATAAALTSLQTDTDDIQAKIGAPVGTLASDIASVQTDTNDIQLKIGTPVSTLSGDIAGIQTKLGTPAGATVSDDIAAIKADTAAIIDAATGGGVTLSPAAEEQLVDAIWDELQASHAVVGSFGNYLDVTVSSRESGVDAQSRFDATAASIAAVQADTDDIQARIGTPVGTVSSDIAAVKTVVDANASTAIDIKAKTDQLTFTGANVNANAQVVSDKTGYALSTAGIDALVDKVWDEQLAGHLTPGSAGYALASAVTGTPGDIAVAVWDALVADHSIPNTFGDYVQVIRQSTFGVFNEISNPTYGLAALHDQAGNNTLSIINEVNQNETKIDAIIPFIGTQTSTLKAEIDQNQILIQALSIQEAASRDAIINEVNQNEVKIDAVLAEIGTLQNNTTVRFIVPERLVKPESGTKTYQFQLRLYDDVGHARAPDSTPTIQIKRLDTGLDVVTNDPMTPDGVKVGAYFYNFTISAGTAEYPALVEATVVQGGSTILVPAVTEVTEFESDLNAIQASLDDIEAIVNNTDQTVTNPVYGLPAIKAGQDEIIVEVDQNEALLYAIKFKTDALPADPASAAQVAAVNATVLTRPTLAEITTQINLARDYIVGPDNRNITQVYNKIDFTGLLHTNDPRLNYLDAAVSSRSTLDAATVWSFGTRTLTSSALPTASVKAIWDYLASQATVPGSMGKRIVDNLDVPVSTRATSSQVAGALAGVAQESTLNALGGLVSTGDNETQLLITDMQADVDAIRAKTQNLPSDPASNSTVASGFAATSTALANLDLKTTTIKTKTDALPPDPAKETSVLARPTNPLLANDIRISRLDVPVSTRSTLQQSDLAGLATGAALASAQTALTSEINVNEAKIDTLQATANQIKVKTDHIPNQPVSKGDLDAAVDILIDEIDAAAGGGGGGGLTAAEVWTYPSRTITQDPQSFGPDISDLATKEDVANIQTNTNVCRMSTSLNSTDGAHEVIVWLEKNSVPFTAASNARVQVRSTEGGLLWEANLLAPNADGVFAFSAPFIPPAADRNYYIEMVISDGTTDFIGRSAFITVG